MSDQSNEVGPRAGMFKELLSNASLAWKLLLDPRVSLAAKLVPLAAALYVLSPIDIIPDWLLGLGQLDDLAIVLLGIRLFISLSPPELVQWYRNHVGGSNAQNASDEYTVDGSYRVVDE